MIPFEPRHLSVTLLMLIVGSSVRLLFAVNFSADSLSGNGYRRELADHTYALTRESIYKSTRQVAMDLRKIDMLFSC